MRKLFSHLETPEVGCLSHHGIISRGEESQVPLCGSVPADWQVDTALCRDGSRGQAHSPRRTRLGPGLSALSPHFGWTLAMSLWTQGSHASPPGPKTPCSALHRWGLRCFSFSAGLCADPCCILPTSQEVPSDQRFILQAGLRHILSSSIQTISSTYIG